MLTVALVALASCSSGQNGNGNGPARVGGDGVTSPDGPSVQSQLDSFPKATLSDDERAGLLWMREEEKLAHDVYAVLGDQWDIKVFANIADAEQTHTDAVKALLDRYDLADPSAAHTPGVFSDPAIQSLYDALTMQGAGSLIDALTVGATIEDLDIADLQARATTTPDIALVYANLEKGSRNHLRAFTRQLDKNGATYTPTHISQAAYDAIVAGDIEKGSAG